MPTPKSPSRHAAARLLSREEVAEHLQVSTKTIDRKIATGEFAAMRVGKLIRISEEELRAYKQRCRI